MRPRVLLSFLVCLALAVPAFAEPQQFTAVVVSVAEGDTISVLTQDKRKITIRFYGIDAPELRQPGGAEAKDAIRRLQGERVTISKMGTDRYKRTSAVVDYMGRCVNLDQVAMGNAWFYPQQCKASWVCGQLKIAEAEARAGGLGLWADKNPVPPWEWKKRHGKARRQEGAVLKGNKS